MKNRVIGCHCPLVHPAKEGLCLFSLEIWASHITPHTSRRHLVAVNWIWKSLKRNENWFQAVIDVRVVSTCWSVCWSVVAVHTQDYITHQQTTRQSSVHTPHLNSLMVRTDWGLDVNMNDDPTVTCGAPAGFSPVWLRSQQGVWRGSAVLTQRHDSHPPMQSLQSLAKCYQVSLSWLFGQKK